MKTLLLVLLFVRLAFAASGPSTTHLWSPVYPTAVQASAFPTTDTLRCNAWVPENTLTNATRIAFQMTAGLGGGAMCSLTVYTDDGSTIVATTSATACATTGPVAVTGLSAFNLTQGVKYQVCICASATGGSYLTGVPSGTALTDLENVFAGAPLGSVAANPCLGGVEPSTTSGLTPTAVNPPIVLFETSTP